MALGDLVDQRVRAQWRVIALCIRAMSRDQKAPPLSPARLDLVRLRNSQERRPPKQTRVHQNLIH